MRKLLVRGKVRREREGLREPPLGDRHREEALDQRPRNPEADPKRSRRR
jgi:hypothetical protein